MENSDAFREKKLGDEALNARSLVDALGHYDSAIAGRPQYWSAHYGRGEVLMRQGRYLVAASAFWSAWLFGRFRTEPALMCARCLTLANFCFEAVAIFEKVELSGYDKVSIMYLAHALAKEGRVREGLKLLPNIKDLDSASAERVRGHIFAEMGWVNEAKKSFEKLVDSDSDGFVVDQLIGVYYTLGDISALDKILRRACEKYKSNYYIASRAVLSIVKGGANS